MLYHKYIMTHVSVKDFDVNQLSYHKVGNYNNGGKYVSLKYGSSQAFKVKTPLMKTWGVNERNDYNNPDVIKGYDVAFRFNSNDVKANKFLDMVKQIQGKIITDAIANSKEWFGKQYKPSQREVVEEKFNYILKYPKKKDESGELDYTRDPWITAKFKYWDGEFDESLGLFHLTEKNEKGHPKKLHDYEVDELGKHICELVPRDSQLIGLLAFQKLWFVGGNFGLTIQIKEACVEPGYNLSNEGPSFTLDADEEEQVNAIRQIKETKSKSTEAFVESDDDEEEDVHVAGVVESKEFSDNDSVGNVEDEVNDTFNSVDDVDVDEDELAKEVSNVVTVKTPTPKKKKKKKKVVKKKQ